MRQEFEEYVAARGDRLLRFGYVLCGDRHLAEDLVQEVLVKAYRRWSKIESDEPEAYLRKAMVRTHVSWLRRRSSGERPHAAPPDGASPSPDHALRQAARDEMWTHLAGLSRAQRAVLVLRFYEDLDDRRIAELLGCAIGTVRVHASRGLARLRADLIPAVAVAATSGDPR